MRSGKQLEFKLPHKFFSQVLTIASGTAIAQAITLVCMPVVTRIYSPESFGIFATFSALLSIAATISTYNYALAIVLPRENNDAALLVKLSIVLAAFNSSILFVISVLWQEPILKALNLEGNGYVLYMLSLGCFVAGVMSVLSNWLVREMRFRTESLAKIFQSFATNLTKIAVGILLPIPFNLVSIGAGSAIFYIVFCLIMEFKHFSQPRRSRRSFSEEVNGLTDIARSFIAFPWFRTPQNLVSAISQSLPILLLSSMYTSAATAQYALAVSVLLVPTNLVGASVQSVCLSHLADARNNRRTVTPMLMRSVTLLFFVSMIPFAALFFGGATLFAIIFGTVWETAGVFACLLAPWAFTITVNRPCIAAISILRLERVYLIFEIALAAARGSVMLVCAQRNVDVQAAVGYFAGVGFVGHLILTAYVLNSAAKLDAELEKKGQDPIPDSLSN